MFPSFLLAKLYVKDSLKNTATGFEFGLKNIIDSTILIGIGPISVGEKTYLGEEIKITVADRTVDGTELSRHNPLPVHVGMPFKVSVSGNQLEPGAHKIAVVATTSEIGKIKFDINETVS